MTKIKWALLPVLVVALMTGAGIVAAQEQSESPYAPSDLTAEVRYGGLGERFGDSADEYYVVFSWIPGDLPEGVEKDGEQVFAWEVGEDRTLENIGNAIWGEFVDVTPIFPNDRYPRMIASMVIGRDHNWGNHNGRYLEYDHEYVFQILNFPQGRVEEYNTLRSNTVTLRTPVAPEQTEEQEEPREKTKPSGLTAAQDGAAVVLNWTPGYNPNYVKQVVTRREAVKGTKLEVIHTFTRAADEMEVDTYTDTTVEAGKRYIYRIKALKANDKGKMSNAAKITVR